MKLNKLVSILIILLLSINPSFAQGRYGSGGGQENQGNQGDCQNPDSVSEDLSFTDEEIASLKFMHEEEKLAHDLYEAFSEMWGLRIFSNISRSEARHQMKVSGMLKAGGIDDSVVDSNSAGVFINQELQALYAQLLAKGSVSEIEALKVGALVEEVDIEDLQTGLDSAQNESLIRLYENLKSASENHLRAFVRNIESQGETYTAQVLPSSVVEEILSSSVAKGKKKLSKKKQGKKLKKNKKAKGAGKGGKGKKGRKGNGGNK